jgi:uncharacterized protein YecE (DUF72 family)
MGTTIYIGTAGWSIPKEHASQFPGAGTHLERYARRFNAVEINTTFYRPHRPNTFARWGSGVPAGFRFAVKIPKEITHIARLAGVEERLDRFIGEVAWLGEKLGPLLVQLPPSLRFNAAVAGRFFTALRERFAGSAVCEPRHPSWFLQEAGELLGGFQVARTAADPPPHPLAAEPGGWTGLVYYRLHGSPQMYYSPYSSETLDSLARKLANSAHSGAETWCIFGNTAEGAATSNALELIQTLRRQER